MEFIGPRADSNCPSAARAIKFSPRDDKYHIARLLMLFLVNRILSKLIKTNRNCTTVPCNKRVNRIRVKALISVIIPAGPITDLLSAPGSIRSRAI